MTAAEAGCSLEAMHSRDDNESVGFDPWARRFECPRLVEGVSWLGAQLGVLYGESNGRLFALAAVKEAVLQMAYCLAVGVRNGAAGGGEGEVGAGGGAGEKGSNAGDVVAGHVFLSQVAAAIMALHERFSLEKSKALEAQRSSKYQLYAFLKSRVLLFRHCILSLKFTMMLQMKAYESILSSTPRL